MNILIYIVILRVRKNKALKFFPKRDQVTIMNTYVIARIRVFQKEYIIVLLPYIIKHLLARHTRLTELKILKLHY